MTQLNGRSGPGGLGPAPPPPSGDLRGRGFSSEERRRRLRASESPRPPILSNFCPIERYYAASDKVLAAFEESVSAGDLDAAYVYGLRFSAFGTKALPTHDYYQSPRPEHTRLRNKNRSDLIRTVDALEKVVDAMDREEVERAKREEEERKKREEMERLRRKAMELQRAREEADRQRHEAEMEQQRQRDLENSVAAKLAMLYKIPPRAPSDTTSLLNIFDGQQPSGVQGDKEIQGSKSDVIPILSDLPPPVLPPPGGSAEPPSALASHPDQAPSSHLPPPPSYSELPPSYSELMDETTDVSKQGNQTPAADQQPPSIPSEAPPPPYAAAAGGARTDKRADVVTAHQRPSSISTPFVPPPDWEARPPSSVPEPTKPKKPEAPPVPIRTLRRACTAEYDSMKKRKAVEVFFLSTYQGRLKQPGHDSTNGCTVISPLVAAKHLRSEGAGIADVMIEEVIDREAPSILRSIRGKLGLPGGALIIPSDVHDYLVDHKILSQKEFVGVCGGNVLDAEHMGEVLDLLRDGYDHNHLKDLKDDNGNKRKLPKRKQKVAAAFFFHEHVMSILKVVPSTGKPWYDIVDSLPHRDSRNGAKASRTRCKDRSNLEATLRWYACSRFSESDCSYIDSNRWDENMCDFDPRVFQAFVWAAD
uniref:Uncharacterized protein n=1 Tax=Odontella aurita TaxID=265563 RepID=A0A7S4JQ41_9STRA|mmetsp:Transcript_51296/g.154149  ORF Transcript_51296/g.154149 Transcript_51296/m.154149 type:complete len:647 (+) Transcript_51296:222-2162(+)|eukprot:CAMPEP_0113540604 /NCGR_PEP_ID=MMETSP0015_2-20120614/8573_1 /TAXON_ID=2838 /ORGANISM="Odontella" /LENGTH=646 /DNA_ID=CAMNT_0000440427 /DNA_START=120 /DNA_END=2060 /DNA_ORIENTATION=- /assembly_acc=CAM_ASM_000160